MFCQLPPQHLPRSIVTVFRRRTTCFIWSTVANIPYTLASALLFTVIFYPMVGFTGFGTAVLFWLNLSLLMLMQTYFGQLFVYALPSQEVAAILGVLANSIFFLFMGFSPPADALPSGYKWHGRV
uniref:ABC-2 type transporter transmembrane domain-containing protein n=1 Tax=Globisporangium ultimum (strain ATCC 200006 / CBS 805.95 / DAOM BR144) TaxID=431595 RepID=K3WZK1_GLOUD